MVLGDQETMFFIDHAKPDMDVVVTYCDMRNTHFVDPYFPQGLFSNVFDSNLRKFWWNECLALGFVTGRILQVMVLKNLNKWKEYEYEWS